MSLLLLARMVSETSPTLKTGDTVGLLVYLGVFLGALLIVGLIEKVKR